MCSLLCRLSAPLPGFFVVLKCRNVKHPVASLALFCMLAARQRRPLRFPELPHLPGVGRCRCWARVSFVSRRVSSCQVFPRFFRFVCFSGVTWPGPSGCAPSFSPLSSASPLLSVFLRLVRSIYTLRRRSCKTVRLSLCKSKL